MHNQINHRLGNMKLFLRSEGRIQSLQSKQLSTKMPAALESDISLLSQCSANCYASETPQCCLLHFYYVFVFACIHQVLVHQSLLCQWLCIIVMVMAGTDLFSGEVSILCSTVMCCITVWPLQMSCMRVCRHTLITWWPYN